MPNLNQSINILTLIVALYLTYSFFINFWKNKKFTEDFHLMIAFALMVVTTVSIIVGEYHLFGNFTIMSNKYIEILTTLVSIEIAVGLMYKFYPKVATKFTIVMFLGFIFAFAKIIGLVGGKFDMTSIMSTIANLTIIGLPIMVVRLKKAPKEYYLISASAVSGSFGDITASIISANPDLSAFIERFINEIFSSSILLMALVFAWAFLKTSKSSLVKDVLKMTK